MKTDMPPASQASPLPAVSMVENAVSTACKDAKAESVLNRIKKGKWKDKVTHIMTTYKQVFAETNDHNKAKNAISRLKWSLPGVLWSGRFRERNSSAIEKHSGLLVMDLDDLTDAAIRTAREQLQTDQYVLACFLSPSGTGLKVLFRIPKDPLCHKAAWQAAANHIKKLTGLEVDSSGKDLARLCFVSYDPDLYFNPTARELPVTVDTSPMAYSGAQPSLDNATFQLRRSSAEELLGSVDWIDDTKGYITCPGEKLHTNRDGHRDCMIYVDGAPNLKCMHNSCSAVCESFSTKLQRKIAATESASTLTKPPTEWFILPSDDYPITESAKQIFSTIAPTHSLFHRSGQVMELERRQDGIYYLAPVTPDSFRSRIETYGKTVGVLKRGIRGEQILKQKMCSESLAKALLSTKGTNLLPPVNQVLGSPVIVEEAGKSKVLGQGYYPTNGGILICGGKTPPTIPLQEAVKSLKNLLAGYDFKTASDKSRALASFITPALRIGGLLKGHTPIDMTEADDSQSGKTLRQRVVAAIYNEIASFVTIREGGVGSLDESFSRALIQGQPFILIDNVRGKFNSQTIEAFLTCGDLFPARIPHRKEMMVDSTSYMLQLSSNGIQVTPDLANRASICRINKRPESYQFKQYPEGDLVEHVRANCTVYLAGVFSIVSEWIRRGKAKTQEARHSFREWAQSLDWIVQNIFHEAPLLDGHKEAQERTKNPSLSWLRNVAIGLKSENRLGEELIATNLVELCVDKELEIPGSPDLSDEKQSRCKIGTLLRPLFKDTNQINVDGFEVERIVRTERDPKTRIKEENKYYIFREAAGCAGWGKKNPKNIKNKSSEVVSPPCTPCTEQNCVDNTQLEAAVATAIDLFAGHVKGTMSVEQYEEKYQTTFPVDSKPAPKDESEKNRQQWWLNLARKIMVTDFYQNPIDRSTRKSYIIGLKPMKDPDAQAAVEKLSTIKTSLWSTKDLEAGCLLPRNRPPNHNQDDSTLF